jgi:type II secretory pathway component PulF
MAVYAYKAVDSRRLKSAGQIAADSPRQARELLRARGLRVQTIEARSTKVSRTWSPRRRHGAQLASFVRDLATLLGAGIPLLDAMDTVLRQYRGGFASSVMQLRDRVAAGGGLAEAMTEQPQVFDPLAIQMVEVGERAGDLERVFLQLAEFKERSLQLKDRVMAALLYPAIVLGISILATLFLMTVVVPMLLNNLLEAGRPLPLPTRIIKAISDLLLERGWLVAIAAAMAASALVAARNTLLGRKLCDQALLKLPLVGTMASKQAISRIALVTATMLRSGVVFIPAIELAARSTSNSIFRKALESIAGEIGAGRDIGKAMEHTAAFPPMVVQIFAVGQQSGQLETMLERLAIDYDRQVASLSARLATALEPLLILFLAIFVGFILFATILPILEAGNVL